MSVQQMRTCVYEATYWSSQSLIRGIGEADAKVREAGGIVDREGTFCASVLVDLKEKPGGGWSADFKHYLLLAYFLPIGALDPLDKTTHQA